MTIETFDPYTESGKDDLDEAMAALGWAECLSIGGNESTMYIQSWQRTRQDGTTEYALDVWGINSGSLPMRVDSFPDLMDLLARWAPAVQAAAVVQLMDDLRVGSLSTYGTVEQIAARVAYGVQDALPAMRRSEREAAAYRARMREQRKPQS